MTNFTLIKMTQIQIPDSIRNWSIDLVLQQFPEFLAYHFKPRKPINFTGRSISPRLSTGDLGFKSYIDIDPTSLSDIIDFLESDDVKALIQKYNEHPSYPYACNPISIAALYFLEIAGIDGIQLQTSTDRQFQSSAKYLPHQVNIVRVEYAGHHAPWVLDWTADQHIRSEPLIDSDSPEGIVELANKIRANQTQSSPLAGPLAYFDKLYI